MRIWLQFLGVIVVCLCMNRLVLAQPGADKTILTIEIMLPKIVGDPVQAQRWGKAFEGLGESVRIRQPLPGDEPEIKETTRGTFRLITVRGELDRKGTLSFPGKTFSLQQTDQIKLWLDEIKVYGAQGSPEGKKFWGLNKEQFDAVVEGLSEPLKTDVAQTALMKAIAALPISKNLPVVVHPAVQEAFSKVEGTVITQELNGISSGTALAAMLKEHGFAFRPLRRPDSSIELRIEALDSLSDPWPVGWDIDDTTPRNQIVPNLFEFVKTGFAAASLQRVLDAISEQTKTPILIDYRLCRLKEIDVATATVSYPEKQTAWSLVLGSVVRQCQLTHKIMLDEAGTPFVWVAPFVPYKLPEK